MVTTVFGRLRDTSSRHSWHPHETPTTYIGLIETQISRAIYQRLLKRSKNLLFLEIFIHLPDVAIRSMICLNAFWHLSEKNNNYRKLFDPIHVRIINNLHGGTQWFRENIGQFCRWPRFFMKEISIEKLIFFRTPPQLEAIKNHVMSDR